jgi:hypothetical protein
MSGSARARRVLLWHLIRREHPAHQFRDTPDFCDDEFEVVRTLEEITEIYDGWVKAGGRDKKDGDVVEGVFLAEIEEARQRGDAPG